MSTNLIILIAQAVPSPDPWAQLGAQAVVGVVLLLIVRWMLTSFQKALERIFRVMSVNTAALIALQQQHLLHDVTTANLPDDERGRRAQERYDAIQKILDDLRYRVLDGAGREAAA